MNARATLDLAPLLADEPTGLEAGVSADDHHSQRLWLRLLACSTDIETEIRRRLRVQFGMTLARFDYLAQLHRHREGLRMSVLSRNLMVTGLNGRAALYSRRNCACEGVQNGASASSTSPFSGRWWLMKLAMSAGVLARPSWSNRSEK